LQIAAAVTHSNVRYVQGEGHSLEFADGSFDPVWLVILLERVSDPAKVLTEMRRVTRQGGRVVACENDVTFRLESSDGQPAGPVKPSDHRW
jgi:ubiquinone/menaquinone biosynthesis C-methylase UbiE